MASFIIKDVYFLIGIHQAPMSYLHFILDGIVYPFKDLYFGLSTGPVFTCMLMLMSTCAHSLGILLH